MLMAELFGHALEMGSDLCSQVRQITGMNAAEPLIWIRGQFALIESQQGLPSGRELERIRFEIPVPKTVLSPLNGQRQLCMTAGIIETSGRRWLDDLGLKLRPLLKTLVLLAVAMPSRPSRE